MISSRRCWGSAGPECRRSSHDSLAPVSSARNEAGSAWPTVSGWLSWPVSAMTPCAASLGGSPAPEGSASGQRACRTSGRGSSRILRRSCSSASSSASLSALPCAATLRRCSTTRRSRITAMSSCSREVRCSLSIPGRYTVMSGSPRADGSLEPFKGIPTQHLLKPCQSASVPTVSPVGAYRVSRTPDGRCLPGRGIHPAAAGRCRSRCGARLPRWVPPRTGPPATGP